MDLPGLSMVMNEEAPPSPFQQEGKHIFRGQWMDQDTMRRIWRGISETEPSSGEEPGSPGRCLVENDADAIVHVAFPKDPDEIVEIIDDDVPAEDDEQDGTITANQITQVKWFIWANVLLIPSPEEPLVLFVLVREKTLDLAIDRAAARIESVYAKEIQRLLQQESSKENDNLEDMIDAAFFMLPSRKGKRVSNQTNPATPANIGKKDEKDAKVLLYVFNLLRSLNAEVLGPAIVADGKAMVSDDMACRLVRVHQCVASSSVE
jgi:hypothetical protein